MRNGPAIGFPPPLLGDAPQRFAVLGHGAGWLALQKPAGVGVRAHPWDVGVPNLDQALNLQLEAAKPELAAYDAELLGSIYYLEPEVSGVALFATNREALEALRNAFGSGEFRFVFRFVAQLQPGLEEGQLLESDAPLLPHDWKLKMIPSTAKGKKAQTRVRCLSVSSSGWALCEALTCYPRMHQVRAHAAVLGLPVLGDSLYGGPDAPLLRDLMPKKRGPGMAASVFDGLALHLAEVSIPRIGSVVAGLPRPFEVLLKRLGLNR
ncbi:pseudouridine synthase [Coraliomargarita akajimensis]|nr:pseudouridine synthase [Coraliomargarita akajimensis]